ncbi:hypothetical protein R6U79_12560 [Pseudomonas putida]|uniref:hypothetical protein n=1 Tax=Pseudomonas putida TaxID=303 RepID=UPI0029DE7D93|nr:hypothetical protein [Pseudomonas putida]WPK03036.1 hypothetical protein R6U79_12560 [Pseudomonas putida]
MSIIFDPITLNQVRADADAHNVDVSRCKIKAIAEGGYTVTFDAPIVDVSRYLPDCPTQHHARSAAEAEGLMLTGLTKIQRAERQAVRTGCVGRDAVWINRTPITSAELEQHKRHLAELALQRKIAAELKEAVELREREVERAEGADLSQRYPGTVTKARKQKSAPAPVLPTVQTKPTTPRSIV